MKVCDKCKGKSKSHKEFGSPKKGTLGDKEFHLCQECCFDLEKELGVASSVINE